MRAHASRRRLPVASILAACLTASCSTDPASPPLAPQSRETESPGTTEHRGTAGAWRPMPSGTSELLWSVWGSPDEVLAVGDLGETVHLPGAAISWTDRDSGTRAVLCDVWSSRATQAIAVGLDGAMIGYDGSAWRTLGSGTGRDLNDAYGFEGGEEFVVGEAGLILSRSGGGAFQPMAGATGVNLFGVWGSSPDHLLAVGVGGTIVTWDGAAWSFLDSPVPENLNAVWGASASDVWTVGDLGYIARFDGSAWTLVASGTDANLYDVWGSDAGDVWAVGAGGTILHFDGAGWGAVPSGVPEDLFGVWGRSVEEAYAVGADGRILRFGPARREVFLLHDHPDGDVVRPTYGLRLDDLLDPPGPYTFSFDYEDSSESARVLLEHDPEGGTVRIFGRAFGGRDVGDAWSDTQSGWIDIDFTYRASVRQGSGCTDASPGDDLHVTAPSLGNQGTVSLPWADDALFVLMDKANNAGCSFAFDNDEDPKGNAGLAADPEVWSGFGWFESEAIWDWLFTGERVSAGAP